MSIAAAIKRHVRAGQLFQLQLMMDSDTPKRGFYLSPEINDLLYGPWNSDEHKIRSSRLQAELESFARGKHISVCMTPTKARAIHDMAILHPPKAAVWDYRSRAPKPGPGLRLFGHFALPDHFIAFTWYPRSKPWNGKQEMGDQLHPLWNVAMNHCKTEWQGLFPKHEPFYSENCHEYITSAADFDSDP